MKTGKEEHSGLEQSIGSGASSPSVHGGSVEFTATGGRVVLDMPVGVWEELLLLLGYAAGAAGRRGDFPQLWRWIALANRLNANNPRFTPYRIPAEYGGKE